MTTRRNVCLWPLRQAVKLVKWHILNELEALGFACLLASLPTYVRRNAAIGLP